MLNSKLPPRQKMINLMYIIFIAIVSISISNSVIDGYGEVYKKEQIANEELAKVVNERYAVVIELIEESTDNPIIVNLEQKIKIINNNAENAVAAIAGIRESIARYMDGVDYVEDEIHNFKKSTDVINSIIRVSEGGHSKDLYRQLTTYKELLISSGLSKDKYNVIDRYLYKRSGQQYDEWERDVFSGESVVNTMSILNRIETGVLLCEDLVYMEAYVNVLSTINDEVEAMTESNAEMERLNRKKDELIAELSIEKPRVSTRAMVVSKMDSKLYYGVETQLDLFVDGDDINDIVVQTNNGTISNRDGLWFVKPLDGTNDAQIIVKRIADGKEYNLATYSYKVQYLPDPRPILSFKNIDNKSIVYRGYTPIRKEYLIRDAKIGAELKNLEIDVDFEVIHFDVICVSNGEIAIYESKNNKFTTEQKRAILGLRDNDKLHITSIVVMGSDGVERTISSLNVALI